MLPKLANFQLMFIIHIYVIDTNMLLTHNIQQYNIDELFLKHSADQSHIAVDLNYVFYFQSRVFVHTFQLSSDESKHPSELVTLT